MLIVSHGGRTVTYHTHPGGPHQLSSMLTDQRDSLVVFCLKSNHFLAFVDNFSGSYDSLNSKGFGLPPILSDMTGGERAIDTECKKQISEWKATLADKTEVRLETEPT